MYLKIKISTNFLYQQEVKNKCLVYTDVSELWNKNNLNLQMCPKKLEIKERYSDKFR